MCSVTYLCLTPCSPMDCSPLGSSVRGICQARYYSRWPFPTVGDLLDPGVEHMPPVSPASAGGFFTTSAPRKPALEIFWHFKALYFNWERYLWSTKIYYSLLLTNKKFPILLQLHSLANSLINMYSPMWRPDILLPYCVSSSLLSTCNSFALEKHALWGW